MDKHYWKEGYKHLWDPASKKEELIQKMIIADTGFEVEIHGLGAGSTAFISGTAKDNSMEKGDADLYIPKIDTYVEVTGPNIKMTIDKPLWFRPDKFVNTYNKIKDSKGKGHFAVHILDEKNSDQKIIRVINLNTAFFDLLGEKKFGIVTPTIRGRTEKYYEIPSNSNVIISFEVFIRELRHLP